MLCSGSRYLFSPCQGVGLSPEMLDFNSRMKSLRITIEWTFGNILTKFQFIEYRLNQKLFCLFLLGIPFPDLAVLKGGSVKSLLEIEKEMSPCICVIVCLKRLSMYTDSVPPYIGTVILYKRKLLLVVSSSRCREILRCDNDSRVITRNRGSHRGSND